MEEKKKNKKKVWLICLLIFGMVVLVLGSLFLIIGNNKNNDDTTSKTVHEEEKSIYRMSGNSLEKFDLSFLQLENEKVNKIYSPLSIKYALKMLEEGAEGNSKVQISSIIGDYKMNKYANSQYMSLANAIFIRNTYKDAINSDYTKKLLNDYNAEVIYDSFESPNNFNAWLKNKTFNLIDNVADDISDKDFILVNALAINMEWNNVIQATAEKGDIFGVSYIHENFDMNIMPIVADNYEIIKFNNNSQEIKTVKIGAAINNYDIISILGEDNIRKTVGEEYSKWYAAGGCGDDTLPVDKYLDLYIKEIGTNYKNVDGSTDFSLYDDDEVKVFAKDLKEYNGTTLQYIGIMPKSVSLDSYIENINSAKLNNVINNLKEIKSEDFEEGVVTKIEGNIPLFNFDYELKLMDDLKKMGIEDVFDANKANLSNMIKDGSAFISDTAHKTNIEFSNEGIKAAAVTTDGGLGNVNGCRFDYYYDVPVKTIDLTFDKPYMFLIKDKNSGEVWFVGTVYNPLSE